MYTPFALVKFRSKHLATSSVHGLELMHPHAAGTADAGIERTTKWITSHLFGVLGAHAIARRARRLLLALLRVQHLVLHGRQAAVGARLHLLVLDVEHFRADKTLGVPEQVDVVLEWLSLSDAKGLSVREPCCRHEAGEWGPAIEAGWEHVKQRCTDEEGRRRRESGMGRVDSRFMRLLALPAQGRDERLGVFAIVLQRLDCPAGGGGGLEAVAGCVVVDDLDEFLHVGLESLLV